MPGSAPKGIKSQAPCLHHVQLQCPAPGAAGPTLPVEVFWRPRAAPEFQQPPGGPHGPTAMLQGGRWPEGAQVWSHFGCTSECLGPGRGALGSTQMQQRDPGEAGGGGEGSGWLLEKAGLQTLGRWWKAEGNAGGSGRCGEGKGNSSHLMDDCGRTSGCQR